MMENVIDLYVRSKVGHSYLARDDLKCFNFNMATNDGLGITTTTDTQPREEDEVLKAALTAFAKKNGLDLVIHDLADKKERRKAMLRGIVKTPVFFYRGMRFHRMPSENDFSMPTKVFVYTKPQIIMSMRPRVFDHCSTLGLKWVGSTEVTYSPDEELTLKKLQDLEKQGHTELHIKDLNNKWTLVLARLRGIKKPSLRIVYGDKRPDIITQIENSKLNILENAIIQKPSAELHIKARESTKYLKWIPAKFGIMLGLLFLALLAIFRLIESRAASYTEIHDTLWFYMLLLALLPSISGLISMVEYYFDMRISETMLIRYLQKQGILAYC